MPFVWSHHRCGGHVVIWRGRFGRCRWRWIDLKAYGRRERMYTQIGVRHKKKYTIQLHCDWNCDGIIERKVGIGRL